MSADRGDDISPEQQEFLLFQNAMVDLGGTDTDWWHLIRYGFQSSGDIRASWIRWFREQAEAGDERAKQLLVKVAELRMTR